MHNYLKKIIDHKKEEIALKKKEQPLNVLKGGRKASQKSLKANLTIDSLAIICEIKRRSPSKGNLREIPDPALIAKDYESNGAAAISILTDREFFGGSSEDLIAIKETVDVPVLRKDFIIDEYQVYESDYIGADAILLITHCLDRHELEALFTLAKSLEMEVLFEVESSEDINKIADIPAEIIGINNRNLRTFEQSLDASFQLVDSLPENVIKVSESSISTVDQMIKLSKAGFDGFLIGETFMKAENPGATLAEFIKTFSLSEDVSC